MPSCLTPTKECNNKSVSVDKCGAFVSSLYFTVPCIDAGKVAKKTVYSATNSGSSTYRVPNYPPLNGVYPTYHTVWSGAASETHDYGYAYKTTPVGTKERECKELNVAYSGSTSASVTYNWPSGYHDAGEDYITSSSITSTRSSVTGNWTTIYVDNYTVSGSTTTTISGAAYAPSPNLTNWSSPVASGSQTVTDPYDPDNPDDAFTSTDSGSITYTFVTIADLSTEANLRFADITAWTPNSSCYSSVSASYYMCGDPEAPVLSAPQTTSSYQFRFRWKIPDEHLGTYFKITWDILNEPTGWNTTTLLRSYYLEDQTYEWTGGAGGGMDRFSDWYEIPVPDFVGQRRVVNVRYECYRTTDYGNKPQVTGEAVTLPDS